MKELVADVTISSMEEVDIAQILSVRAGKHLGEAYAMYIQSESSSHTGEFRQYG